MVNRRQLLTRTATGVGAIAAVGLSGCASHSIDDYAQDKPSLDLRSYFNGKVDAWASSPTAKARSSSASPST